MNEVDFPRSPNSRTGSTFDVTSSTTPSKIPRVPLGVSTGKGVEKGPTWSQLWRQNVEQCDQMRIKSRGGLQTQEAKLEKNEADSHFEFYNELEYQIN